jgi:hypothetical protein
MFIGIVRRRQESPQLVIKVGSLYPAFPCGEDPPALSAEQRAAAPITLSVPGNLRNPVIAIAFRRPVSSCATVSVPKASMYLGDHPKAAIDDQVKRGHRETA